MTIRPNARAFAPLPQAFRPVISQALVCDLFVERNAAYWGSVDHPLYLWGFLRENKTWHRTRECANYMTDVWDADRRDIPFEDFRPLIFRDIQRVIRPLLESGASPAEQRRAGSFCFVNGVVKMLEHDLRIIILPWELHALPRPMREQEAAERRAILEEERRSR